MSNGIYEVWIEMLIVIETRATYHTAKAAPLSKLLLDTYRHSATKPVLIDFCHR